MPESNMAILIYRKGHLLKNNPIIRIFYLEKMWRLPPHYCKPGFPLNYHLYP